ncbi:ATP-grasp domain-containing protein [Neobacillus sp. YIM B02564]|uniref:ATP-grasp domain-containing protein n=1 Tax=Neobacillus paridis TaxID=2803862 RepID=A0ABS1TT27_9BACI|nr:ATP-grasp domain-containing protein [Neobacillus paridis]MBL4954471.1 ATP-grasp domain-containing protein [Neobacillus paridis]
MKKVMFLGGAMMQLPAIKYAKKQGYYTILCDYLADNPGQYYANEYYCVSTTDKEAVLAIAIEKEIDGVFAYVSDPAAPTAAYVANQLNLPSNPYESVVILTKKDLFRKFLQDNGFNCPKADSFKTLKEAREKIKEFHFPIIVKPVDTSASRGISLVKSIEEIEQAFLNAISQSKEKKVIIEEYIEMSHDYQIGGDVFVLDGKLAFCGFLNCHRNKQLNPLIPIGKSYPVMIEDEKAELIRQELQRIIDLLDIKMGAMNIEAVFGKDHKPYFIEIGPRNGGNMISNLLELITGIDFVQASVECAIGNHSIRMDFEPKEEYYSSYTLHSAKQGILTDITFSKAIEENIISKYIYKDQGTAIDIFTAGNKALGFVFLKFDSLEEQLYKMDHMNQYITVNVL